MNNTTDNFAEPMFATKEDTLKLFTDDELKNELKSRGYNLIMQMVEDKDMVDEDLGNGL